MAAFPDEPVLFLLSQTDSPILPTPALMLAALRTAEPGGLKPSSVVHGPQRLALGKCVQCSQQSHIRPSITATFYKILLSLSFSFVQAKT